MMYLSPVLMVPSKLIIALDFGRLMVTSPLNKSCYSVIRDY